VRPECIPGSAKIKNDRSDSDSILAEASPLGTAQLIPNLKWHFNKIFILVRTECIPGSAKIKNARSVATAFWLKPPHTGEQRS